MWNSQIWFVSKTVTATAQGSGDHCDRVAFQTLNCSPGIAWVDHRIFCSVSFGLSNLHRLNICMVRGVCEMRTWGKGSSLVKYSALAQFLPCHNISDNTIQRSVDSNILSSLSYLYYLFFSDMY